MKKVLTWLDLYLEETVLVILLIAITLVMTLQIVMRYIFNYSLMWPEEFNRLCFIVSAFFTMGYAIRKKKMLRVDIVMTLVPKRLATVIDFIGKVISLVFYVYIFFFGVVVFTTNSFKQSATTPALGVPWYIVYTVVCIGFGLAVVRSVQELVLDTIAVIKKKREEVKS